MVDGTQDDVADFHGERRVIHGAVQQSRAALPLRGMAGAGQTRVFYMGVQRLAQIAQALIAHGLPPDTPAAIVQDGARPTQSVLAHPLRRLVEIAPPYGPRPGLLIIGETVRLSPSFEE